ncbi:hypothetical protein NLM24_40450 [Nocardia zapadnayensis]|nr:hypothetical protein [Nocardia zapadnayensis]MCX0276796.1 hypothetical protein [Nocardia zapadnayensis]
MLLNACLDHAGGPEARLDVFALGDLLVVEHRDATVPERVVVRRVEHGLPGERIDRQVVDGGEWHRDDDDVSGGRCLCRRARRGAVAEFRNELVKRLRAAGIAQHDVDPRGDREPCDRGADGSAADDSENSHGISFVRVRHRPGPAGNRTPLGRHRRHPLSQGAGHLGAGPRVTAVSQGFEPWEGGCPSTVFKTARLLLFILVTEPPQV